ncbi:hypothetical protein J6590_048490 [Homalodisca vitripennis]|nr:hypothetical protein J6590_048490 [Homalodisca vitripennis]
MQIQPPSTRETEFSLDLKNLHHKCLWPPVRTPVTPAVPLHASGKKGKHPPDSTYIQAKINQIVRLQILTVSHTMFPIDRVTLSIASEVSFSTSANLKVLFLVATSRLTCAQISSIGGVLAVVRRQPHHFMAP